MQHIIKEIKETFLGFINDEEKTILLVEAAAEESLLLLKSLSMLEDDELSPDIFAQHTEAFTDTRSYVEALFENQTLQLESVNEILAERQEPPLEEFPPELSNRSIVNHDRLTGIAVHVRKIVQPERKVIWVFFPLEETEQEEAYANLLRHLAYQVFDQTIEQTKLIIRDTTNRAVLARLADQEEKVEVYEAKLDTESIFKKIEEQSKNPDAPPDERAQNMMLMAGVDVAEKRYDRALKRNESVLGYFEKSKQPEKQSVVYNNIGDIYYLQGDFPAAQAHYEKAIDISIDQESQPMMIYQSINVGNALFMQQKYDEALIYYDSSAKLAAINKLVVQQIQALERKGDTLKAQGKTAEAIETWEKAAGICRENGYQLGLVGILERLNSAYDETGQTDKRDKTWQELQEARGTVREIEPALLEK